MNRTTRTTRYALIRYHYCTSNQSLTTRCLTNYWPKKLVQRFWWTDTVTVKRKKHLRAAGSPDSLAQRPVKNPTLRSGPFRIDQNVSIEGPAHHVPRLPKRSRICCFFPRIEALRITILFAAGRWLFFFFF